MRAMLCDTGRADERFDPDMWATEAKFDGWRLICHRTSDLRAIPGGIRMYAGRNGSDYSGQLPYVEAALLRALPPDTTVDGEIVALNGWGGVQSAMTTGHRHETDDLVLVIFDVIRVTGNDVRAQPWTNRRRLVELCAVEGHKQLAISPLFPTAPATLDAVIANGFEGVVLKRKSSRYVEGRSPFWVKIKPQSTAEARVIGFKPGEGSFAGLVGALEFEMLDTGARSRCSGFDMALRREITANPDQWLGQIIEIKHHGLGKEGKPRHPQYLRRRDDRTVTPVTTPVSEARENPARRSDVSQYRMRNYAAMNTAKLERCIEELAAGQGDAYERCVSKGGDPQADLEVARTTLRDRRAWAQDAKP